MSILNEMGIQQWRLRDRSKASVAAEPAAFAPAENNESSSPESQEPPQAQIASQDTASVLDHDHKPDDSSELPEVVVASDPIAELDWQGLQALIDGQNHCVSCSAHNSILGSGDANADWMFVSDAPVRADLETLQLFNGRAGQLYEAMLLAIGLDRKSVYTTSIFKCVASDDLSITPSCNSILHRQIELVQPKVVVTFGEFAAQSAARANEAIDMLRTHDLHCVRTRVPIVASFTPAQMLDEPSLKALVWQDLKKALAVVK